MGIERARHPHEGSTDGEHRDAVRQHVLAQHPGHHVVLADRPQRAAQRRPADALGDEEGQGDDGGDQRQIDQRIGFALKHPGEGAGVDLEAPRTLGDLVLVEGDQAHDLAEPQRHHGEEILAQPDRQERHQRPRHHPGDRRHRHRQPDRPARLGGQQAAGVGAQRIEPGDAEIDHAGHAPLQVQGQRQDHEEADIGRHRNQIGGHLPSYFLISGWPNSPCGRTSSRMAMMAKPTPTL